MGRINTTSVVGKLLDLAPGKTVWLLSAFLENLKVKELQLLQYSVQLPGVEDIDHSLMFRKLWA